MLSLLACALEVGCKNKGYFVLKHSNNQGGQGQSRLSGYRMECLTSISSSSSGKPDSQVGHLSGIDCGEQGSTAVRSSREQWASTVSLNCAQIISSSHNSSQSPLLEAAPV